MSDVAQQPQSLVLPIVVVAPPLTGMTIVSGVAVDRVRAAGGDVFTVSSRGWMSRPVWSVFKHLRLTLLTVRGLLGTKRSLYLVPDSGAGLWGTLLLVTLMRAFRRKHVLHHHVYLYLNSHSRVMELIVRIGGTYTDHVLLGESMRLKFVDRYRPSRTRIVDNLGITFSSLVDTEIKRLLPEGSVAKGPLRFGFLGRLNDEKGLGILEDFVAAATAEPFELKLAGSASGAEMERVKALTRNPAVDYLGPVYEADKVDFLKNIDWLLFPTQYDREAQPLVIWEAALAGAEILAITKGAIAEQVDSLDGETAPDSASFVQAALRIVATRSRPSAQERTQRIERIAKLAEHRLIDLDQVLCLKPGPP